MNHLPKFALIGAAGYIAPRHMKAIRDVGGELVAAIDKHDNVGIIDGFFPHAHFFTEFERFDRHIEKMRLRNEAIDYVSICSPNYLHDAHIRFGLRNGADVICEKPLVLNPWNIESLIDIEKQSGRRVYNILQLRLHPAIVALKEKVDDRWLRLRSATEQIVLEHKATERTVPENKATERTVPENKATERTGPENIATERTGPENKATELTATEQIATEQTATERTADKTEFQSAQTPNAKAIIRRSFSEGEPLNRTAPNTAYAEALAKAGKHDITLTYITSRGLWYYTSWKGDMSKSGGIATNIGVHFFDMLTWIFGPVTDNRVHLHEHDRAAGYLEFANARVRWFLSIEESTLPNEVRAQGKRTFRSMTIDGENFEFSDGFTDLHTRSYEHILEGKGFGLSEATAAIEIVHNIRTQIPIGLQGDYHPFAALELKKHPFGG